MNRNLSLLQPPEPPADDLDRLLRAFYRAELPDPFPRLDAPAEEPAGKPARRPGNRPAWASRAALAASVGLVFLGTWLLSGSFAVYPTREPEYFSDPTATRQVPFLIQDRTPAGRNVLLKGTVIQAVEEEIGPDGRPVRKFAPRTIRVDVIDHDQP